MMEEQEKIDIREHLIGWIDSFLEDGIIPQVVNPKAIRANYILKSKIKEKIKELEECVECLGNDGMELTYKESAEAQIQVLHELMEE